MDKPFVPQDFDYGRLEVNASDIGLIGIHRPVAGSMVVCVANALPNLNDAYGDGAARAYAEEIACRFNEVRTLRDRCVILERELAAHTAAAKALPLPAQSIYREALEEAGAAALAADPKRYNW